MNSNKTTSQISTDRLAEVLTRLESALDHSPLSPRKGFQRSKSFSEGLNSTNPSEDSVYQLLQAYRALYFDFYYITDELVSYGVRSSAVRHSLMLADLVYGVVFSHEIFRTFMAQIVHNGDELIFPRLLLPWIRQLRHFLSFFPENQEAIVSLRKLYEQLDKFEHHRQSD